ncbi:Rv3654c family TadE-like protein [Ruania halotolerans]|uniref:Rv3654c family TadE-like protein n=1 Tax=Ruania halotolerans TaxID=2897773 RepID=UPI001E4E4751|nr:Rv3654c family TadE-like protein [Ruania halotolerans]UFU07139.1 flp pilus-assembly TadE/G-like family protein [Ruania halotolerans]
MTSEHPEQPGHPEHPERSERSGRTGRAHRDAGSVTVLVLGVVAAALLCFTLLSAFVQATAARGHAQGVADLAALAAASEAVVGEPDPCRMAALVAERNGASLVTCAVGDGPLVDVRVQVPVHPLPGWRDVASAEARAGPVGL